MMVGDTDDGRRCRWKILVTVVVEIAGDNGGRSCEVEEEACMGRTLKMLMIAGDGGRC